MSNKTRRREDGFTNFDMTITAGDVMSIGDMVAAVSNKAVPASDFTYAGGSGGTYATLALAQAAFVLAFLGVSRESSRAVDTFTSRVIDKSGFFEFDCASATLEVGALVGPAGDTSGATYALSNQAVVGVADKSLAIGRVVRRGTSVTKALVEIFPRMVGRFGGASGGGSVYEIAFNVAAAEITGTLNVVTGFKPGHNFKIEGVNAVVGSALTGSSKTVTLNAEIDTVDVTGGVLVVASASAALGTYVEGTAVMAANQGGPASVIDIESSSVTAFSGGQFSIILRIRNLDV